MKPIEDRHPNPRGTGRRVWRTCLLLALLCLAACQVRRPSGVLTDEEMEGVLYDYHIAVSMGADLSHGEEYKKVLYTDYAFRKHGITRADFDSSLAWYARYPEKIAKLYDRVDTRLKAARDGVEQRIAMRDHKPTGTKAGDSVDVWGGERVYRITGVPLGNKFAFSLPADSNFQPRDTLRWTLRVRFPRGVPDSLHAPLMALQLAYTSDTVTARLKRLYRPGTDTLCLAPDSLCLAADSLGRLHADSLGSLKSVSGFLYFPTDDPTALLLVDRIALMRYHDRDTLRTLPADSLVQEGTQPSDSLARTHEAPEAGKPGNAAPQDEGMKPQEPLKGDPRRPRVRPRPASGTEKVPLRKARDVR